PDVELVDSRTVAARRGPAGATSAGSLMTEAQHGRLRDLGEWPDAERARLRQGRPGLSLAVRSGTRLVAASAVAFAPRAHHGLGRFRADRGTTAGLPGRSA